MVPDRPGNGEQFERLLDSLGINPGLTGAVIDWLDPDSSPHFPYGGEDDVYSRNEPPYFVANGLISSPSELLAINGFDPETYALLAPFVSALPRGTRLNVNTAPAEVLASLSEEIGLQMAESLIEERADVGFSSVTTSFQGLVSEEMLPRIDGVTDHFLLSGRVTIGDTQLTMSSVLQRDPSGVTRVLFRSFGDL